MLWKVHCPAKINTFLSVGPKDARGYHPLRTIFQAIGLRDELHITVGKTGPLTSDWADLPAENTVSRAMRLVREIYSLPPHQVHLVKRIPSQAGLGGGSTDAAGYLRFAYKASGGAIPMHEMGAIALAVGADVPFFMTGGRARGEGYGEVLTNLPDLPSRPLVLVQPADTVCSTPEMFRALDEKPYDWRELTDVDEIYNDFERVAPCACSDTIERLQVLGCSQAGLTGSGSVVFGFADSVEHAQEIAEKARAENLGQVWATETISRRDSLRIEM